MQDLFHEGFGPFPDEGAAAGNDLRWTGGPGDVSVEIDRILQDNVRLDREVRRLRAWREAISSGDAVRSTAISGTIPLVNGGSGTTENMFGAVSLIQQNSGGTLTQGAVLVRNGDRFGTTTTAARNQDVLGVLDDASVATGLNAHVRQAGYQAFLQVTGAVVAGHFLATSTVAGKAQDVGTVILPGVFARAMTADTGGFVAAWVFPVIAGEETAIEFLFDGGGSVLPTGIRGDLEVAFDCTVTGWTLVANGAGSLVIDVWRDSFANFPPTVADTITGTEKPTLAAAQTAQDLNLTSWATSLSRGEWLRLNVDSAATITRASLSLRVVKR